MHTAPLMSHASEMPPVYVGILAVDQQYAGGQAGAVLIWVTGLVEGVRYAVELSLETVSTRGLGYRTRVYLQDAVIGADEGEGEGEMYASRYRKCSAVCEVTLEQVQRWRKNWGHISNRQGEMGPRLLFDTERVRENVWHEGVSAR
jgi:hypothetical protein